MPTLSPIDAPPRTRQGRGVMHPLGAFEILLPFRRISGASPRAMTLAALQHLILAAQALG